MSESPLEYRGALLGVHAQVSLYRRRERAIITLRGMPLGGRISGVAHFDADGVNVRLDPELNRALSKRHVKIEGAGVVDRFEKVWVTVQLPLKLGTHKMYLTRLV